MTISIGDLIAQFKDPAPEPRVGAAEEWFAEFQAWLVNDYERVVHHVRKPGLHASALGSVCGRRNLLISAFGANVVKHTAGNYFTFDVGHAMHFWWQERYLGPKQELWGDWMCAACPCPKCGPHIAKLGDLSREEKQEIYKSCGTCQKTGRKVTRGFMPLECSCGVSWQDAVRYLELPVENEELDYVGHTDGVLVHSKWPKRVFEFKTISPTEYDKLNAGPKLDHIVQAHAYMSPLGLDEALIIYENKGSQAKWSVNMFGQFVAGDAKVLPFTVRFDQELWDGIVLRIHDHHRSLTVVNDFREKGKPLPRAEISKFARVCEDNKCDIAKRCPVSRECFSLD